MRPEALAVAGYYPFPVRLLPALADLISLDHAAPSHHTLTLADFCAGEGEAIYALAGALAECHPALARLRITACEMEAGRFVALRARAYRDRLPASLDPYHADAFTLIPQGGAHLLLLNPPYGAHRGHGRIEQQWLARFTQTLLPGEGILLFVVPHAALAASAAYLAIHYEHLACLRLPDPEFADYGQVVLLGRRAPAALATLRAAGASTEPAARIRAWGEAPDALPVLGRDRVEIVLPFHRDGSLRCAVGRVNLVDLIPHVKPWTHGPGTPLPDSGLASGLEQLVGRPYPVAMPPKPAHLALALASGAFNGKRIEPDDLASALPPVLLKGAFTREYATLSTNLDKKGNAASELQVQQPRLAVTALDLTTYRYVTIKEGHLPTGAATLDGLTMGDLLAAYGSGLADLMSVQFPPMHQPDAAADQISLPHLGRTLFAAQHQAVQAAVKLIGRRINPFLISEVGTGKTTMALATAAALAPATRATTKAALARVQPKAAALPTARRILVLCPPHLLTSWTQETRAVLPGARAIVLSRVADLNQALAEHAHFEHAIDQNWEAQPGAGMTVYILSREMAKLSHPVAPAPWRLGNDLLCPRCGTPISLPADQLAARRIRCEARPAHPTNEAARVARAVAALVAVYHPEDERLDALLSGRVLRQARARRLGQAATNWAAESLDVGREWALRRIVAGLGALTDPYADPAPSLAAAGEALLAACPPPQRAGLGLDLAEQLYARTKEGDRRRETALRLLLLSGVVNSPFEAARVGEGGPWAELRLTRAVLAGASQTGASPYGPRRWYGYSLNRAGAPALGDLPFGRSDLALDALGHLLSAAQFSQGSLCDEPLFGAVPNPRRYPLAKYITRQARGLFDLCILDECQEYATAGSAQEKAAHRLVDLPGVPTISLSGSLINGYSSSLFANMWALSRAFRADFPRDGKSDFVSRFGFRKRLVLLNPDLNRQTRVAAYGSRSDREEIIESEAIRQMGEAPGVLPLFILRHLLPEAILVHKNDLDLNLPPLDEYPVSVEFNQSPEDRRLASQYLDLTGRLLAAIKNDRSTDRAGMLWGAMSELPSYLDLAAEDTGNVADPRGAGRYEIRYPAEAGGDLIAQADPLPAAHRTAKERWLLATVQAELGEDRNVLLFVRHSGREGRLPKRLARLLKEDLGVTAAILEVEKVAAAKRQDWIDQEAIARGRRVLIVNPQAVKTGLNNLVFYATGIFFELDHSAICYRQAVGRLHRIGQTKPVRVYYPVFRDTAQTTARDLLGQKIKASLQTDGLDIESALEAVGAGDESSRGGARAALSLGHEIYNRLSGRPLPPITFTPLAPSAPLGPPPRPAAPPATRSATPDPDWSGPRVQLSLFA